MKNYFSLTLFFLLLFFSCEEDPKVIQIQPSINIIYPENNSTMVCDSEGNWYDDNMQDFACQEIEDKSSCQDIDSCEWILLDYNQDLTCQDIQDPIQCENTNDCEWLNESCQIKEICQDKNDNCIVEIKVNIENKESADLAQILVNGSVISNGSLDTLTAYYKPPSGVNQDNINIEARLIDFSESLCTSYDNQDDCLASNEECMWTDTNCYSENFTVLATAYSTLNINTEETDSYFINPTFLNVDNQFSMMRFPVTNREFISFLNSNDYLEVEIVDIIWDDEDNLGYGDPNDCEFDALDQYEPTEWWYVNVKANFGNQDLPSGMYSVYKNGYNIYDANADYSNQGGKIRYDCYLQKFYLPNEDDGSESIYLDHPVTGVTWVGATIYANHFGWTLPSAEQWLIAAGISESNIYPWGNDIDENYANYNSNSTTPVGYYNGIGTLNLSLSPYGIYDMIGNVWELTSSPSNEESYKKFGGAFNSEIDELSNYAYSIYDQSLNHTGFRCIANIGYPSYPAIGCMQEGKCNFDSFAQQNSECFDDDCLNICGGTAEEFIFYEDSDGDGLGNQNSTELQCNEPEEGWVDNDDDLIDENCPSDDINQDNIDCNIECNGEAYIDGCGDCVGGSTNEEACVQDCNGVDNGSAERDDCDVCAGGDTGLEPNQDLDCNGICDPSTPQGQIDLENGFEFGAFVDDCNNCVEGGTGLEENYADLGCGCDEDEPEYYCLDSNSNGCCDCGNDNDGAWDECDSDSDADLVCDNDLTADYISTLLGCSDDMAENYYCDNEDNQCISFGTNIIPPCNFIDDGSCVVYGCSDPNAINYLDNATICEDGTLNGCCDYAPTVYINFGAVNDTTMEILINTPNSEVGGFQFFIEGTNIISGSGGLAEDAGFVISSAASQVLGFSFSGTVIPEGSNGILTILNYSPTDTNACFNLGIGAISNGTGDALLAQFGDQPETNPDTIQNDDCIILP